MAETLTLCAVGDLFFDREDGDSIFAKSGSVIRGADIAFGQLESPLSLRGQPVPNARAPLRGHPRNARVLKKAGFDVLSFASNHTLDIGVDALLDTIENITEQGIPLIGVGKDLDDARKPAIIKKKGMRVGFLAYCSILPVGYDARPGKPGANPMRAWTSYQPIEAFQPGTPCRILTYANEEDLDAMRQDIKKLRSQVDVLIISIHWGLHHVPALLAMYQREVGHAAIDAGADLILGHHAHILKPIEVYKGKAIFYSLGNFATELSQKVINKWAQASPEMKSTREVYGLTKTPEASNFPFHADARKTMIAKCIIADGKITRVSYLPVMIDSKTNPKVLSSGDPDFGAIVRYMKKLDKSQNIHTRYSIDGDEVVIRVPHR